MSDADTRFRERPEDPRPCERSIVLPRYAGRHRGVLLLVLSVLSMALGGTSLPLMLPALLGFPLAAVAYLMADWDLAEMRAGRMDAAGRRHADLAQWCAIAGLVLSGLGLTLGCVLLGVYIYRASD
jgi:hypothetical protein